MDGSERGSPGGVRTLIGFVTGACQRQIGDPMSQNFGFALASDDCQPFHHQHAISEPLEAPLNVLQQLWPEPSSTVNDKTSGQGQAKKVHCAVITWL